MRLKLLGTISYRELEGKRSSSCRVRKHIGRKLLIERKVTLIGLTQYTKHIDNPKT